MDYITNIFCWGFSVPPWNQRRFIFLALSLTLCDWSKKMFYLTTKYTKEFHLIVYASRSLFISSIPAVLLPSSQSCLHRNLINITDRFFRNIVLELGSTWGCMERYFNLENPCLFWKIISRGNKIESIFFRLFCSDQIWYDQLSKLFLNLFCLFIFVLYCRFFPHFIVGNMNFYDYFYWKFPAAIRIGSLWNGNLLVVNKFILPVVLSMVITSVSNNYIHFLTRNGSNIRFYFKNLGKHQKIL